MKTFIIQTVKKDVYDHEEHQKLADNKASDAGQEPEYYRGLRTLAQLIFWSIVVALCNALIQVTIGYVEHPISAICCILFSIFSWGLFGFVLKTVAENMQDMISYAEKDAKKMSQKKLENDPN